MADRFGGVRTVLDVAGEIERQQQAREQQEMTGVMNMAKLDPKGAEGAWNRGYLGIKYGRVTLDPAKSKGAKSFFHYSDGTGKRQGIWIDRDTMEITPAELPGEARPETSGIDLSRSAKDKLIQAELPETKEGWVELGKRESIAKAEQAAEKKLAKFEKVLTSDDEDAKRLLMEEIREKYPSAAIKVTKGTELIKEVGRGKTAAWRETKRIPTEDVTFPEDAYLEDVDFELLGRMLLSEEVFKTRRGRYGPSRLGGQEPAVETAPRRAEEEVVPQGAAGTGLDGGRPVARKGSRHFQKLAEDLFGGK